jgi:diaminopimelate decarboxylase
VREFTFHENRLQCESVPLADVACAHGTPLYVYSAGLIRRRCREIEEAFGSREHLTCYAVKANANRQLLHLIAEQGLGADVGSGGELELALGAGFAPERVTFSGVGKRDDEIVLALEHGVSAFNVESAEEMEVLSALAVRHSCTARVLLRVNFDIDAGGHAYVSTSLKHNKFGVPRQHAAGVLRRAAGLPGIEVRGVHSHIGSQITNRTVFLSAASAIVELVRELRSQGIPLHDVDFGGGFGVQYHGVLSHPALPREMPEGGAHDPTTILRDVLPILDETGCRVLIQPGRAIVGQAGLLLTTVLYRKAMEEKVFVVVDAGMNDLIRPSLYNAYHQIVPLVVGGSGTETVDVVGPVCESGDFFARGRRFPVVKRGDQLAILCAGAYGFVLSSNYNARLRPAEVLIDGGAVRLIRERQRLAQL